MHITTGENWLFEIKEVRATKTKAYGKPYTANVTLKIVLGDLYVESALSVEEITRKDWIEIEQHISELGFSEYWFCRYKNNEKFKVERVIK